MGSHEIRGCGAEPYVDLNGGNPELPPRGRRHRDRAAAALVSYRWLGLAYPDDTDGQILNRDRPGRHGDGQPVLALQKACDDLRLHHTEGSAAQRDRVDVRESPTENGRSELHNERFAGIQQILDELKIEA